jgi:rare lipoprotein A
MARFKSSNVLACLKRFSRLFVLLNIIAVLSACTASTQKTPAMRPSRLPKPYQVNGIWYQPIPHARGFEQQGLASWYGREFHGHRTSNGETYDMYGISAAHKTLPFGTYVQVQNLQNGKSLNVRINDRGPFAHDRIIDLSYGAAEKLGIVGPGTAPVRIVALGAPTGKNPSGPDATYVPIDYYTGKFTFQVGAFTEKANAERLVAKLGKRFNHAHIIPFFDGRRTFYRVRVGCVNDLEAAAQYEKTLIKEGFSQTFIVAE